MNTEIEPVKTDFDVLEGASAEPALAPALTDSIASLSTQLQDERDKRKEERFLWILGTVVLLDCIAFPNLQWMALPIFLLEVIGLIFVAKWLGVEAIAVHLQKLFEKGLGWSDKKPPKD